MFAVKVSEEVNEDPINESRYMRKRERKFEQKYYQSHQPLPSRQKASESPLESETTEKDRDTSSVNRGGSRQEYLEELA